ncbi:MAG: DUF5011 domain-containing protein [Bacteroidales bacterium]|nr:DUF5011 domain-containing protein [Bacteroidales bacterium]
MKPKRFILISIVIFLAFSLAIFSCKKKDEKPKDTTPPVITLLGSSPVYSAKDSLYVDAGATAADDVDGDITGKIQVANPVNIHVEGTYKVKYNVTDAAGNNAVEVSRTVIVAIM